MKIISFLSSDKGNAEVVTQGSYEYPHKHLMYYT